MLAKKKDIYIAIAVTIQSALLLFQTLLVDVLRMEPESTTIYRVVLTVAFLVPAIFFSFKRNKSVWIVVYSITAVILFLHSSFFPENSQYIVSHSMRFLLPVVIPSALCIFSLRDIQYVEKGIFISSFFCLFFIVIYAAAFFLGLFIIDGYNMSFGYACLFPMLVFYSRKEKIYKLVSFALLFIVLAIGSRGPAVCFVFYLLYDLLQRKKKYIPLAIISILIFIVFLPQILDVLDSIGISSRSLTMLLNNDTSDSGRGEIYRKVFDKLNEHPLFGLGLYGDRPVMEGAYCHNILLEMLVDWGYLAGGILILFFFSKIAKVYLKCNKEQRNIIVKYGCATIVPLMVSGSYLDSYDFGFFVGILLLLDKHNKTRVQAPKTIRQPIVDNDPKLVETINL